MKLHCLAALSLVLVVATPTLAQETIRLGEPFILVADHDGANTTAFQVETLPPNASAPVITETRPVSELANGMIQFPFPQGLPANMPIGTYQVRILAVGPNGAGHSAILQLVVVAGPNPIPIDPANIRIIRPTPGD